MKKFLSFALLLCIISASQVVLAQNQQVSGKVLSDEGEPLMGTTILVAGTSRGTLSGEDGSYTVMANAAKDTLVFSFIGYQSQRVAINNQATIDITMVAEAEDLDEVVIVGYGSMKKSDLTGSVYSVKGEDLVKNPSANVLQSLQGKVPGVQVSSVSGNPGESPVVRIRGVSTFLGGSSPVFVVDGMILDDISFLNSGDIESIEVLKDASATAIYGTRGANGVIIVTTKNGSEGKPVINFGATYSLEYVPNRIELLETREFAAVVNEIQPGRFNNIDALPNTDWQDLVFNTPAAIQKYELSISGSEGRHSFYGGASYYVQEGVIEKSDYERVSVKLNNQFKANKVLTLGSQLTFSKEHKNNAPNVVSTAYRAWPTSEPLDDQGNFLEVEGNGNPIASLEYSNSWNDRFRAISNVYADINFLKDFSFRTSFQMDGSYLKSTSFSPVFFVSTTQQNEINNLSKGARDEITWIWENIARYTKEIKKHRFDVMAGYTSQQTRREGLSGNVEDLIRETDDFFYLDAGDATTINAFNGVEKFSYISYLSRLNYVFNDRYLFTATFRRDGSSKFGPNNRYGNFPSLAVGWRIDQEKFMENLPVFNSLKIRASWGINGNDRIPYQSRFARVNSGGLGAVFGPGEVLIPGATLDNPGNPNLQWENTETYDAGIEFGLFNNRLTSEIEYYNKRTNKVLVALLLPAHFGNGAFQRVVFNAADVRNQGFEFYIKWKDNIDKFRYSVGFLGSTTKNKVLDIGAADEFLSDGSLGNGQLVTRTQEGLPIGSFFGYKVAGVFQNQQDLDTYPVLAGQKIGDFRYEDVNADGKINADDRTLLGSYIPDFLMGVDLALGYKGFDLLVDVQGQFGNEIYNGKRAVRPELYNFEKFIEDRWTGEGTSTTQPRLSTGGVNYSPSDWFIEDGSFVRLRSVSLSYTPPRVFLTKLYLQNASIFLRGTNLYTSTKFSGYSPEIASQNVLSSGIDLGLYPITSTYSLGINLTF